MKITAYLLRSSALLVALPTVAWAESSGAEADRGIPEIIVTADKFEKSAQKTPIPLTVVGGDEVNELGRTKIDDVLVNQPAVIVQGAARGFLVSIRGLGLSLPPQMGQGAVSTNYDGVNSSRAESASAGFYDLDRVEVLRGPLSTLYGRNSVGGVVNVVSRDPVLGRMEGYLTGEVGDYDLAHIEGAINFPISEKLAVRVAGSDVSRDGYISNGHDDNKAASGRAKLLYQPNDAVRLLLGIEHSGIWGKGGGALPIASIVAENRTTGDVGYGHQDVEATKYWGVLSANAGPGVLKIAPSLQETEGTQLGAFGGNFANSLDPKITRQKALEVAYSSPSGAAFEWNVGYYHYENYNVQETVSGACQDTAGNFVVPPPGYNSAPPGPPGPAAAGTCLPAANAVRTNYRPEIRRTETDSVFGQTTFPVADALRIILGARYSREEIQGINDANADSTTVFTAAPFALPTQKDNHFDYRAGVEADVAEGALLYATVASGYRQGGYGFGGTPYEPEEMTSYEVGLKSRLVQGRVLLNASAFHYDYDSFQLVVANFTVFPPQIYVPTMPGQSTGVELETAVAVGDRGRLNASLTWLDSELDGLNGFYVGLPFPNSPEWQFKAGYAHEIPLGSGTLTPRVDFRALSKQLVFPEQFAVTEDHPSVQPSYVTGDVSLTFTGREGKLSATAYLKNVNDELIKQSHFFGYAQVAAPRMWGLTVTHRF